MLGQKFWSKVAKTPTCWVWLSTLARGYGQYKQQGKYQYAHRLAYQETFGSIPPGLFVLHRCDNPSCVKPDHLFLGTARDNYLDCVRKGRQWGGWANPNTGRYMRHRFQDMETGVK